MPQIVELSTTTETFEQAQMLARLMVESQLAACVQITGPIQSVYRWQGAVCEVTEFRCVAKSTQSCIERLMALVDERHPYDVPELLVVEVVGCSPAYAQWIVEQLGE